MELKKIRGCPSCDGEVIVTEYYCPKCDITVRGKFEMGPFAALTREQVRIVGAFLASGGNIKQIEARLGMSYPTVKTRLKEINIALGIEETAPNESPNLEVLENLENGEIDVKQALKKLEEERQ
jgi:hypothetical protein